MPRNDSKRTLIIGFTFAGAGVLMAVGLFVYFIIVGALRNEPATVQSSWVAAVWSFMV